MKVQLSKNNIKDRQVHQTISPLEITSKTNVLNVEVNYRRILEVALLERELNNK